MSKLSIKELSEAKAAKRKARYISGKKMCGIFLRKMLHFIVAAVLKIDQMAAKEKIAIIGDRRKPTRGKPTIFACTHPAGNDIQRALQVIRKPAYLILGNPGEVYRMPIYYGLLLNGVIPLETFDKEDRKIAYNRAVELLKNGGNLLIFPEGVWNTTPNYPVMKIFTGAVRMARETGAEIVPIAIQQYDDTIYFNIGENYSIPRNTDKPVEVLNDDLREKLATLQWDILTHSEPLDVGALSDDPVVDFQNGIVEKCEFGDGVTLESTIAERFHDKNVVEYDEAFAHLSSLMASLGNAFLFNKRNHN